MGHCNVGRLKIVSRNTQEGDASFYYNRFVYVNVHGEIEQLLLTDRETEAAKIRAEKNVKLLAQPTFLDRLVRWCLCLLGA